MPLNKEIKPPNQFSKSVYQNQKRKPQKETISQQMWIQMHTERNSFTSRHKITTYLCTFYEKNWRRYFRSASHTYFEIEIYYAKI